MAPPRIGPYDIAETLGRGGTGIVLRCFRRGTGELAAVKIPSLDDARHRDSLRREIGIVSRLSRLALDGVVRVLEHGEDAGAPWYAMELLQGSSLRLWQLRLWGGAGAAAIEQPLTATETIEFGASAPRVAVSGARDAVPRADAARPPGAPRPRAAGGQLERALRVAWRLARTLAALHGEGVIHGDLTPANVILRDESDPVLIDFGAGVVGLEAIGSREARAEPARFLGTPGYTAPEVARGDPPDPRADLYGLGCILHELLTGARAFSGEAADQVTLQQLAYRRVPLSSRVEGCPEDVDRMVQELLNPDPTARLVRAEDVCGVLSRHLGEHPASPRQRPTLYRPRLRGRQALVERVLASVLPEAPDRGRLLLVCGERGSGKSRFLEEVSRSAGQRGLQAQWCPARRSPQPGGHDLIPNRGLEVLSPLIERLLEQRGRAPAGAERDELDEVLEHLQPLAPGLIETTRAAGPALSDAGIERRALGALARALPRLAHDKPMLVLLDDLEWVDELSLAFLRRHASECAERGIVFVACFGAPDPSVLELGERALRIPLPRLLPSEVRQVAKDLLGTDVLPEGLAEFLEEHSENQPMLVVENARAATAHGFLSLLDGEWCFDASSARRHVPAALGALYRDRVAALSPAARVAARGASVLAGDFDVATFHAVVRPDSDPNEMLEELVARDILRPSGPRSYAFAHEQLRAAEEESLGAAERVHYHLRAAEHYERADARQREERAAMLGYHWAAAGNPAVAASYFERAAAAAEASRAWRRASELYRLALEATTDATEHRARLWEALADALLKQSRHLEARSALSRALTELPVTFRLERARAHRKLAASAWTVHEYAQAKEELGRAEAELGDASDHADAAAYFREAIQIRLGRCQQLYFAGEAGPELEALVEELGPLIDAHGTADQSASHYLTVASNLLLRARYQFHPQALGLARKGLAAAMTLPVHRQALAHLIVGGVLMLGAPEDVALSLSHFEQAARGAALDGEVTLTARIRIFHAMALLRTGDLDETEAAAASALEAAEAARLGPYIAAALGCQGWVAWRRNDESAAEVTLRAALERWRTQQHKFPFQHFVLFPLLELARSRDDYGEAAALLGELGSAGLALPQPLESALELARAAIGESRPRDADRRIKDALELARAVGLC